MDTEKFRQQLLATFRAELDDHAATLNKGLLEIEKPLPRDRKEALLKELFRAAHSVKGSARAVEIKDIEAVSHKMEDVFGALKKGELSPSSEVVDLLLTATDLLIRAMSLQLQGDALPVEEKQRVMDDLNSLLKDSKNPSFRPAREDLPLTVPVQNLKKTSVPGTMSQPDISSPTIRVSTDKLDTLMAGMGELLVSRMRMEQRVEEFRTVLQAVTSWEKTWRKVKGRCRSLYQQPVADPDTEMLMEFIHFNEDCLGDVSRKVSQIGNRIENDYRQLRLLTGDMQERVQRVRMIPVAALFDIFPRMIRDIGREKGKEVRLRVTETDAEIDRQILQRLKDPLTHLIRNAVDHGIESPERRKSLGKPLRGTIALSAVQKGNHVVVEVSDDGAGIDFASVRQAAVKKQIIMPEDAEKMDDTESLELIFQSGLSTHDQVTDISGRGVGMDVVRDHLEKMNGQINVDTAPGKGTVIRLILPFTLATSQVLLLKISDQVVGVPTTSVIRILDISDEQIGSVHGKPAIRLDNQTLPLFSMARCLELPAYERSPSGRFPVVVLGAVEKRLAFEVDGFVGNQEVMIKPLGPQLKRVRNIAGATILGTGQIVMILNVTSLMHSARATALPVAVSRKDKPVVRRILVVDDSITTRTLEKNILENVGYKVTQSADGIQGWEALQNEVFDAAVFDIEMPRMDGFELTKKVRQDERFSHLPVILVTSLEKPQDRIRGMEAGADAYILKGSFNQQELLETVERLIG